MASLLYPGNTLSQRVLQDAVWALETNLRLSPPQRRQTCLRLDGGFGTDENLDWVLRRGYRLLAKTKSGRRAGAWGRRVTDWQELIPQKRWAAIPDQQLQFCVPTRTLALRWLNKQGKLKHALLVTTDLASPVELLCQTYNLRGGAEIDIRADKQGLLLTQRRKRAWHAQEMLMLLNDLAHNFIVSFRQIALFDTPLAQFGSYRLIQDVFNIPGEVVFEADRLVELRLKQTHPYADCLAQALLRLWDHHS